MCLKKLRHILDKEIDPAVDKHFGWQDGHRMGRIVKRAPDHKLAAALLEWIMEWMAPVLPSCNLSVFAQALAACASVGGRSGATIGTSVAKALYQAMTPAAAQACGSALKAELLVKLIWAFSPPLHRALAPNDLGLLSYAFAKLAWKRDEELWEALAGGVASMAPNMSPHALSSVQLTAGPLPLALAGMSTVGLSSTLWGLSKLEEDSPDVFELALPHALFYVKGL
eukprot:gene8719-33701_t